MGSCLVVFWSHEGVDCAHVQDGLSGAGDVEAEVSEDGEVQAAGSEFLEVFV